MEIKDKDFWIGSGKQKRKWRVRVTMSRKDQTACFIDYVNQTRKMLDETAIPLEELLEDEEEE